ncbi:hypothetical protein [Ruegeria sp. HKCCA0370]|uniref:hypothetical protein n=1 Tax=Ruegeria sp. HKCCA0370 TaxID=2682995 RepID=UPI001488FFB0|nr:hypothetical protein [Ruegeria sp. HKCCA0370]
MAKPNGYTGEHSKFKPNDPAAIARQKAAQDRRQELRKQKRGRTAAQAVGQTRQPLSLNCY